VNLCVCLIGYSKAFKVSQANISSRTLLFQNVRRRWTLRCCQAARSPCAGWGGRSADLPGGDCHVCGHLPHWVASNACGGAVALPGHLPVPSADMASTPRLVCRCHNDIEVPASKKDYSTRQTNKPNMYVKFAECNCIQ